MPPSRDEASLPALSSLWRHPAVKKDPTQLYAVFASLLQEQRRNYTLGVRVSNYDKTDTYSLGKMVGFTTTLGGRGVAATGNGGGCAGWGVYPRAKAAPRRHGCRRPHPGTWHALGAKRRGVPHRGCEKGRRACHTAPQQACEVRMACGTPSGLMPLR
jgi:hypothetical protein